MDDWLSPTERVPRRFVKNVEFGSVVIAAPTPRKPPPARKYFSNAVREDSILRLSRGGIVFAPGWAGTVQEIFQAATKTFYQTDGPSGAFVFLGVDHWRELPVEALLRPLLARSPHGDLSDLIVVTDSLDVAMAALSQ